MKVFLSGKMDREHGAWRDGLVGGRWDSTFKVNVPRWVSLLPGQGPDDPAPSWPMAEVHTGGTSWPGYRDPILVMNLHEYVGPFRVEYPEIKESKNSGEFHGNTGYGSHGQPDHRLQKGITAACLAAIARADFVFAYINTPDCYGTLCELGYAHALGKYCHLTILRDVEWDWDDYWFAGEIASAESTIQLTETLYHGLDDDDEEGTITHYDESKKVEEAFRDALVRWSATVVRLENPSRNLPIELVKSFATIEKWTSDPRVRGEARRMLHALGGV